MAVTLTPEQLQDIVTAALRAARCGQAEGDGAKGTSFLVKPPEQFNFQDPATWSQWIKRFNTFRNATGLSEKPDDQQLQLHEGLTLAKAVQVVRQAETYEEQQKSLGTKGNFDDVQEVHKGGNPQGRQGKYNVNRSDSGPCKKCGWRVAHSYDKCPARDKICFNGGNKNHFSKVCGRPRRVREVNDGDSKNSFCLSSVYVEERTCNGNNDDAFYIDFTVNGEHVFQFKIDTGADVSCLGLSDARSLGLSISKTCRKLRAAGNLRLKVIGKSSVLLERNGIQYRDMVYVIAGQDEPLLGRGAIKAFSLIKIDEIKIENSWKLKYPKLFNGLGTMGEPYIIKLKPNARPASQICARRIPIPIREKVKLELDAMVKSGVITPVIEATEWCSPLVVIPKKHGKFRLCVDFTHLNKYVERELLVLPSVDECLAQISDAQFFSKLDTNSGFWQVELDKACAKLTTFITPFGRFYFNRLPFGICSAPEHFQLKMIKALEGLEGVANLTDDICVYGKSQEEHDMRLENVLKRLSSQNITLNAEKCEFGARKVKFLGHVLEGGRLYPDLDKTTAIRNMPKPKNISDLRRFIGMVNYIMKFVPKLSELTRPLTELLSKSNEWCWTNQHDKIFDEIKLMIVEPRSLMLYNPLLETRVCADASSFGIGAVIEQKDDKGWRPIQYASRTLSSTESRYAQIEKEALGLTWACDRFTNFLFGKHFDLVTDHKPLIQILGDKPLSDLSPRLQRFKLRLMKFEYTVKHQAGKGFVVPDTLSRAPSHENATENDILDEDIELFIGAIIDTLPCSDSKLNLIKKMVSVDNLCQRLVKTIASGDWSGFENTEFFKERGDLSYLDGLILKGTRIFIPERLRNDILIQIHSGHLGVNKCLGRARDTVWWPGITTQIKNMIQNCSKCIENRTNPNEPLVPSDIPNLPWETVAVDLFAYNRKTYICFQDYFSKYIEMLTLTKVDTESIKCAYMSVFSRHGVPNVVRCDNGTSLVSSEMENFAKEMGFKIVTSSPHFPRSNGQAEKAVGICKNILKKNKDPYIGLLAYRTSPLECGLSPAELIFGRKLRSTLPSLTNKLVPSWPDISRYKEWVGEAKSRSKSYFDKRHRARELMPLRIGCRVWITDLKRYGNIVKQGITKRDYVVESEGGTYRRNRQFLIPSASVATTGPTEDWIGQTIRGANEGEEKEEPRKGSRRAEENEDMAPTETPATGEEEARREEENEDMSPAEPPTSGQEDAGFQGKDGEELGGKHYITRSGRAVRPPVRYGCSSSSISGKRGCKGSRS